LSRLATSFVLGYHGCERSIAVRAVNGEIDILQSKRNFDWLGPGAYFWESDPQRAQEWAQWKADKGDYSSPAVLGAVIDLRNCLDLMSRDDMEMVRVAHQSFLRVQKTALLPIPENRSAPGEDGNADRVLRFLDCAVLKHLHSIVDGQPVEERVIEPFDTVRGMFTEGQPIYNGSAFRAKSHVQIAVRTSACIRGLFLPR